MNADSFPTRPDTGTRTVFHPGERAAQQRAGFVMEEAPIRPFMTEQHRSFFATQDALFAAVADKAGWPVATVLAGPPGFLSSPDATTLHVGAKPSAADPASAGVHVGAPIGLLGIDLGTRRRNRLNGVIETVDGAGFSVGVRQSFGNCPKYIQLRHAEPWEAHETAAELLATLDAGALGVIAAADTTFVASGDGGKGGEAGGLDMSHRGGLPGFVRVAGDVLTIPDYRGNRYFNTFGNLLLDGRMALLFVDWLSGDTLHLQGQAEIVWDGSAVADVAGAERLWRVQVTAGWRRRRAMPRYAFDGYAPQLAGLGVNRDQAAPATAAPRAP